MSTLRFRVVETAFKKKPVEVPTPAEHPSEYFGKYVFNQAKMQQYLSPDVYEQLMNVICNGAPLDRSIADRIAEGITLEDGEIHADEIAYVKENKTEIGVEIHSGRNRIVRRIFESLGYTVRKLDRVYYAGLTKKNLKRGAWRFLTREEVMRLKTGQYE